MKLTVQVVFDVSPGVLDAIKSLCAQSNNTAILAKLDEIALTQERIIQMNTETKALLDDMNTATNAVASRIDTLISKANSQGSLDAAEVNAALAPIRDHLRALATDPVTPVPEIPPVVDAPPASS